MALQVVDVNRLMDHVRIKCPGVLDGVAHMEIFSTLDEFFMKTNIWTDDIAFKVLHTMQRGDQIDIVPDEGLINRLLWVWNGDKAQRRVTMPIPGTLEFAAPVDADGVWSARVALTVTDPVAKSGALEGMPRAPAWVLKKYHEGLLSGVLFRLMSQVAKPYSNPRMALLHNRIYKNAESAAVSEGRHQNLMGGQTWRYPQGFATRRQFSGSI